MAATAFVRARIDEKTRDEAAAVLAGMGLTVSDVVRMALTRVARDGGLPAEYAKPNQETLAAMTEAKVLLKTAGQRFKTAGELFDDLGPGNR